MTDRIESLAKDVGATLAPALSGRELASFKILHSGNVAVDLAGGTKFIIAARRHATDAALSPDVVVAEAFLDIIGPYAVLPIAARPEGRRFIRRTALDASGEPCLRFTEAGRDV